METLVETYTKELNEYLNNLREAWRSFWQNEQDFYYAGGRMGLENYERERYETRKAIKKAVSDINAYTLS